MAKHFVLRMRRELSGEIPAPRWPPGVAVKTLGARPDKKLALAAHGVLTDGFWEGGGGAPIFRKWWSQLRKDSEFDPSLVFIAVNADGVVGMAQCWTSAFVKDIAVLPAMRGRGIGRALMLTTFHAFAKRGALHVDLKVRAENLNAQKLYCDIGMTVIARERD